MKKIKNYNTIIIRCCVPRTIRSRLHIYLEHLKNAHLFTFPCFQYTFTRVVRTLDGYYNNDVKPAFLRPTNTYKLRTWCFFLSNKKYTTTDYCVYAEQPSVVRPVSFCPDTLRNGEIIIIKSRIR